MNLWFSHDLNAKSVESQELSPFGHCFMPSTSVYPLHGRECCALPKQDSSETLVLTQDVSEKQGI